MTLLRLMPFLLLAAPVVAQADDAWTPERHIQLRRIADVQPSPDGKRVVFTVRQAVMTDDKSEYLTHIHLGQANGSGAKALTQGDKSCEQPRWSPDGKQIAFVSKRSGKKDLWLIRTDGGEAARLTQTDADITSYLWSPDGKRIAYTAVEPQTEAEKKSAKEKNDARVIDADVKMSRLYVIDTANSGKPRLLTPGAQSVSGAGRGGYDWSPDGQALVFAHTKSPRPNDWPSADLSIVDVASGKITPLVHTPAAEMTPFWSPDGKWIAFVQSDNPPTWASSGVVHVIPSTGGSLRPLAATFDQWGRYSEIIGWSADSKQLFFSECRRTQVTINALPLDGPPQVVSHGDGTIGEGVLLNSTRTLLGFTWEATHRPVEAQVADVTAFKPVQVSQINPVSAIAKTDVITWKGADGWEVEGLLSYPPGYQKGKKVPLLLVIHGGPMGVYTQSYLAATGPYPVAAFAAKGFAVLRPNPRGSSGYGKKFRFANYGDWGGKDFQDLMAGVDHCISLGIADPDQAGVMGWSYGGFMTSWTLTQTKRFKAASVGAGVTNLMSFTGTADIPSFLPDYFGGEFWDNLEAYRNHSAMFRVKGVTTPTLIQHGDKDERVPLSQGQELYNALKRQGCTVQMVVYPRQPHAIEEPKLQVDAMRRNLEWFERHVK